MPAMLLAVSPIAVSICFWLMVLIALVWTKRHIDINRGRREPVLTEADAQGDGALPELCVLVAAKDEEANIGECVSGLLRQDYPGMRVIVIDDRSGDRTGAIIDDLAQRDARLTTVHVRELPTGWFGKNNAMREGLTRATSSWLCFTDADCKFDSPLLMKAAVRFALREQTEFLSVLPRLIARSFWELVVQPVAGAIMVFWNPPQKVNDPASSCAYANGAFMLMTRAAYERIGGHEAVKATLNEDMHMARRSKAVGVRLRVIRGGDMYRVHMYQGLQQILRGWSRIFYGCFGTLPRLAASLVMLSVFSLSPYVVLPIAAFSESHIALAAGAAIIAQQSVLWRFYVLSGVGASWALTYPLGVVLCLWMTLTAMAKWAGATRTTWRGTTYSGGSSPTTASVHVR